jgi:MFS superfamily sulfate permease-like transporter
MPASDRANWSRDLLASVVVFLVALPLCLGIAIASGVPPALGLVTGVIGGIVVGSLAGAPLLVSGPAAGMAVLVYEIVTQHGLAALGIVVLLGGAIQLVGGLLRVGQVFRAISPPVIYGMLAGIGVLIFASQLHVMLGEAPKESGWQNLVQIPASIAKAVAVGTPQQASALIGVLAIGLLLGWSRFAPQRFKWVPGALIAVIAGTGLAFWFTAPIAYVQIPENLLGSIQWVTPGGLLAAFSDPALIMAAVTVGFVASAETLLSAAAVDRMHDGPRANYDRELVAQGIGNMICGVFGALPMTGVIVRSATNVNAGAKTRRSTILHGVWLFVLVMAVPGLLRLVPTASLAAVLVITGYKLVDVNNIKRLAAYGRMPIIIYISTLVTIVAVDLLTGILAGLALSLLQTLYRLSHLDVHVERDSTTVHVHLSGAATFVRLPRLLASLESLPPSVSDVHIHVHDVAYVDDAVLESLLAWTRQRQISGVQVQLEWDRVIDLYRPGHLIDPSRIRKLIDGGAPAH